MQPIKFSNEERKDIVARIQTYFHEELEHQIGDIPAELLLNFFTDEIGAHYYNRGLYDAQAVLSKQLDQFTDAIYGLEQRPKKR